MLGSKKPWPAPFLMFYEDSNDLKMVDEVFICELSLYAKGAGQGFLLPNG